MECRDAPLSAEAEEYLTWTKEGRLALYVEGLCLADAMLSRSITERFLRGLTDEQFSDITVSPTRN